MENDWEPLRSRVKPPVRMTDEVFQLFLEWRGIEPENVCKGCGGKGERVYGHSTGWRGGMGATCMREDICDRCWGSGDEKHPWTDLRAQRDGERARVAQKAIMHLCEKAGTSIDLCRPAVQALIDEFDKMARGRKARPSHFHGLCEALAKTLRAGLDAPANE